MTPRFYDDPELMRLRMELMDAEHDRDHDKAEELWRQIDEREGWLEGAKDHFMDLRHEIEKELRDE